MKKNIKNILLTVVLLVSANIFAQDDNADPDAPGGDPGAAPIEDYVPLLVLAAVGIGFKLFREANQDTVNENRE